MINYCKENFDNCIVLLETPRVGDTVDNGMGVDFELSKYVLIVRDEEKIPKEMRCRDEVNIFEVERCNSLEEFINELKETDGYEVIWRNNEYKDPDKIKSILQRRGISEINVNVDLLYSLKVSYEEIQKYYETRTKPSSYESDLFREVLEGMSEFDSLVGRSFPLDRAKHKSTHYRKDGIEFFFTIPKKEEIKYKYNDDLSDEQKEKIQRIFEEKSENLMHESIRLWSIVDYIERKIKEWIQ